jgi:hypothetical protein
VQEKHFLTQCTVLSVTQSTQNFPLLNTLLFIVLTPGINEITLWWFLSAETTRLKLRTICLRKLDNKKVSFLYKSHFHYTCDSGRRKGNNFAAGDLKSHSDFPVDCYILHCYVHVIFPKCFEVVYLFFNFPEY